MKNFIVINLHDERKINKYLIDNSFKQIDILPYFCEGYVCFSLNKEFSFDELIILFLKGTDDEQIGSISVIAEKHPYELYDYICKYSDTIPLNKIKYIYEYVIPDYLPLYLPKDRLKNYEFGEDCSDDIWVKILRFINTQL